MKNIPTDLLRTFITIVDVGGFTQAGELLGRSQPAISLQVKRLEEMLDVPLFHRTGGLKLSEKGHILYNSARKMLDINDAVVARLSTPKVSGTVRLGTPNDFEVSFLPVLLSKFSRAYPDVSLNVVSDVSIKLRSEYQKGALDLLMSVDDYPNHQFSEGDFIIERLSWVSDPTFILNKSTAIPLVLYPEGCIYRKRVTTALNTADIAWRVPYCSSSLSGLKSAIKAGLGISALVANTIPETLRTDENEQLPALGLVTIGFNYNELSPAAALLLDYLRKGLKHSQSHLNSSHFNYSDNTLLPAS